MGYIYHKKHLHVYDSVSWRIYEWDNMDNIYILIDVIPFHRAKVLYADILETQEKQNMDPVEMLSKEINKVSIHSRAT